MICCFTPHFFSRKLVVRANTSPTPPVDSISSVSTPSGQLSPVLLASTGTMLTRSALNEVCQFYDSLCEQICNFPDAAGCDGSAAADAEEETDDEAEAVVSVPETAPVIAEWEEPERPEEEEEDWNKPWQPPTPAPRPDYDNK